MSADRMITIRLDAYEALLEERVDLKAVAHTLCAFAAMLCRPRSRTVDVNAERRILGGLAIGRVAVADVVELRAGDFSSPARRALFTTFLRLLDSPPALVLIMQEDRVEATMSPEEREGHLRTWLLRWAPVTAAQTHGLTTATLEAELARCNRPGRVPRREIELVAALGRAWQGDVGSTDRGAK